MKIFSLTLLLLSTCVLLISCKSENKKEVAVPQEPVQIGFQEFSNPIKGNSSLPRLYSNKGKLFMSWVEDKDTVSFLNYSVYENNSWTEPIEVISGSDWFVNWADFPAIAENNGNILTSYLQKSDSATYSYDIKLNLFTPIKENDTLQVSEEIKEGKEWKKNFILHTDGTKSEHGFVSMLPYKEDSFFITWLDGRNTVGSMSHDTHHDEMGEERGAMTLRGAIVKKDGTITQDLQLDNRICDCCQTSAAITTQGPIVVYRDRSEKEIRDISIVRWVNGNWTSPQNVFADEWEIAGCPVNGPSVDAIGDAVAVVWFTGKNENPKVQIVFSKNGGASFDVPIRIDSGVAIGRVDVLLISEKTAVVTWVENKDGATLIQTMKVNSNGSKGTPVTIPDTSEERASGFPQLEKIGDTIYVAFTASFEGNSTIKTFSIPISNL